MGGGQSPVLTIFFSLNRLGGGCGERRGKKLFGCSQRPSYGPIRVSVRTPRLSCALESSVKGIRHNAPSMDFCTLLVIN